MATIRFRGPFAGVQKNEDSSRIGLDEAEDALNLNLDTGTAKKRPGFSEAYAVTDEAILGMFDYVKTDGTITRLFKSGTRLQKDVGGTMTELATGLGAGTLATFATFNGKCYFCDGTVFKVTDGTNVYDAGIAAPGSAPTLALSGAVGAGAMKGEYDYKYTFYSSTWGQESPPSPLSSSIEPDNQNVTVTTSTTAPDARVDKKRIYRRKISASESLWSLTAEVAIATASPVDANFDNNVDFQTVAPLQTTAPPATIRYLAVQGGVMWMASGADNRVYYTRPNQPWILESFEPVGSEGDSDEVTGLHAYQGTTIAFKRRSIWLLTGVSRETIYKRRLHSGFGLANHHAIVEVDGLMYFPGEKTFYLFDGASEPVDIARALLPDWTTRNYSRDSNMVGIHCQEHHAIIWAYSGTSSATNNKAYVHFYANSQRVEKRSWCPWAWQSQAVSALGLLVDSSTEIPQVYLGFESGTIGLLGGGVSDDGIPIERRWRTARLDGGMPDRIKRWGEMEAEFTQQAAVSNVDVNAYLDGGAAILLGTQDTSDPTFRTRVGRSSRDLRLEFTCNTDQDTELVGFSVQGEAMGRA